MKVTDKPDYANLTDNELWQAIAERLWPESSWPMAHKWCPEWPHSVDAALTLPFPDGYDLRIEWTPGKYADVTLQREIGIYTEGGAIYDPRYFTARTRTGDIARPLCLVWLQWKDTQND